MKTNILHRSIYCLVTILAMIFVSSCEKASEDIAISIPDIKTLDVTLIKYESATCGGIIVSDGGFPITQCGVCWNAKDNPTITSDSVAISATNTGTFTCILPKLSEDSTYYVRAFATNTDGISYGKVVQFKIPKRPSVYISFQSATTTSKTYQATIENDGSLPIIERGLNWSIGPIKVIGSISFYTKKDDKTGSGTFSGTISTADAGRYSINAYAITEAGTTYADTAITFINWGTIISKELLTIK